MKREEFCKMFKVGDKITASSIHPHYMTITYIGKDTTFMAIDEETLVERCYQKGEWWKLHNPEPKTVKVARSMIKIGEVWQISEAFYGSEQEAKDGSKFEVVWPAIPDENGFYTVPVEE